MRAVKIALAATRFSSRDDSGFFFTMLFFAGVDDHQNHRMTGFVLAAAFNKTIAPVGTGVQGADGCTSAGAGMEANTRSTNGLDQMVEALRSRRLQIEVWSYSARARNFLIAATG